MESTSTMYYKNKEQMIEANPTQVNPFTLYDQEIAQKCLIDEWVLRNHQAYVVKAKF